jgi:hypothetical protein
MDNEKIAQLMHDLSRLTYNWRGSSGESYTNNVVNKAGVDRVEQVIRQFLLDNRDNENIEFKGTISSLEAKVFMYEQIISKSNFAPMLCTEKIEEGETK